MNMQKFYGVSTAILWILIAANLWCIYRGQKMVKTMRAAEALCHIREAQLRFIAARTLSEAALAEFERMMGDD